MRKRRDRKSTRLNSSHVEISYAVFCLKNKKKNTGAVNLDAGVLSVTGEDVLFADTAESARHGVAVVSQERSLFPYLFIFFFNDTATTEIYTLSLHDALPI